MMVCFNYRTSNEGGADQEVELIDESYFNKDRKVPGRCSIDAGWQARGNGHSYKSYSGKFL